MTKQRYGWSGPRLSSDGAVLNAFIDKRAGESKKLTSDGQHLSGNWMGGSNIAEWKHGKIVLNDLGSRAAQKYQRALIVSTPKKWFAEESSWALGSKRDPGGYLIMVYGRWGSEPYSHEKTLETAKKKAKTASAADPENEYSVEIEPGGSDNPLYRAGKQINSNARDPSKKNREGLTWPEWRNAAGLPLHSTAGKTAWRNGEDPSDWRAAGVQSYPRTPRHSGVKAMRARHGRDPKKGRYEKRVYNLLRKEGYSAEHAMFAARAHFEANEEGLHVAWRDEEEPWDGDAPAPKYLLWGAVYADKDWDEYHGEPKQGGYPLASVGMVGVNKLKDPYLVFEEGNLFAEALQGMNRRLPGVPR